MVDLHTLVGKRVAVSQGYMQFTGTLARHDDDYRVTDGITAVAVFPSSAVASIEEMDTRESCLACADYKINLQES